ncbi:hypothetical protein H0H93_008709, partial [Arthromyces matolae]
MTLTTLPRAIEAMVLSYLSDSPLLLPATEVITAPSFTVVTVSVPTDILIRSDANSYIVANTSSNVTSIGGEPILPIHLSHSVIISMVLASILFVASLFTLYFWRKYYPPRRHPRSDEQPSQQSVELSVVAPGGSSVSTVESLNSLDVISPPVPAHIRTL